MQNPLWKLAKKLLGAPSYMKGDYLHQELRARGIANLEAYDDERGYHWDLFQSEEDFWNDYSDYEFGRVFNCGQHTTDNHGQLIIHTGWYRWADGSVRSAPEHK